MQPTNPLIDLTIDGIVEPDLRVDRPGLFVLQLPRNWSGGPIKWRTALVDIAGRWQPGAGPDRNLPISWERERNRHHSAAGLWAPVTALLSGNDENRCCVACSEVVEDVAMICGVVEDRAEIQWRLELPAGPQQVRMDFRPLPVHKTLAAVTQWWDDAGVAGVPTPPPDHRGKVALYSTWYAYRQGISRLDIERECALATTFGLGGIIVDDGWQQSAVQNDMGCTGSWIPHRLVPDPRNHVASIQGQGLAYLAWMALPFLGYDDDQLPVFRARGWILAEQERIRAAVVDPRIPEVRAWIIGHCTRTISTLGLDGLKLDFLDRFARVWDGSTCLHADADCTSVGAGVVRLVDELEQAIHGQWPGVPIEFRQRYIGPIPRRCGNIMRAMDCPNDHVENRRRTVDTRLLAGAAVVHADMVIWHADEPTASAALQILAVFHAVPQISVRLATLQPDHARMLRFLIGLWNRYRDTLLDGQFTPRGHCASWSHLCSSDDSRRIDMLHASSLVRWTQQDPPERVLINATREANIAVINIPAGELIIYDCMGSEVYTEQFTAPRAMDDWPVPAAGVAVFTQRQ